VTSRRIPGLGRRIVMTCSSFLEPDMWAAGRHLRPLCGRFPATAAWWPRPDALPPRLP